VSKAGYYAWRKRETSDSKRSDAELLKQIRLIHKRSHARYGAPRIHIELRAAGMRVSVKRIARLMRLAGLKGKKRNRSKASSFAPGALPAAPNILDRKFNVSEPNTFWVSDITNFPTKEGWLYLAVVIDCYSRRVVGYSMDKYNDASFALAALIMGLLTRPYGELVLHNDRGSQYASQEFTQFLALCGIRASMSRKGNCWDNAVAESFFASMKVELEPEVTWATRAEARAAIIEYIENWYNPKRRHSTIGFLSPIDFENLPVN
jgi:putative transposase